MGMQIDDERTWSILRRELEATWVERKGTWLRKDDQSCRLWLLECDPFHVEKCEWLNEHVARLSWFCRGGDVYTAINKIRDMIEAGAGLSATVEITLMDAETGTAYGDTSLLSGEVVEILNPDYDANSSEPIMVAITVASKDYIFERKMRGENIGPDWNWK